MSAHDGFIARLVGQLGYAHDRTPSVPRLKFAWLSLMASLARAVGDVSVSPWVVCCSPPLEASWSLPNAAGELVWAAVDWRLKEGGGGHILLVIA